MVAFMLFLIVHWLGLWQHSLLDRCSPTVNSAAPYFPKLPNLVQNLLSLRQRDIFYWHIVHQKGLAPFHNNITDARVKRASHTRAMPETADPPDLPETQSAHSTSSEFCARAKGKKHTYMRWCADKHLKTNREWGVGCRVPQFLWCNKFCGLQKISEKLAISSCKPVRVRSNKQNTAKMFYKQWWK